MENWDDLRFCLALSRYHTMSAAAEHLGTNVGTVSRRIHGFAERLGFPLFEKNGVGWAPTEEAKGLIACAEQTEQQLIFVTSQCDAGARDREVRVSCAPEMRQADLVRKVGDFWRDNPDIRLNMSFRSASLAYGETDILITPELISEGNLLRKRVGAITYGVWCGADFQGRDQLKGWIMSQGMQGVEGIYGALRDRFGAPYLTTSDRTVEADVVVDAPFCAVLSEPYALSHGGLRLLSEYPGMEQDIYLYIHALRKKDATVRRVMDWLEGTFAARSDRLVLSAIPDQHLD
jgi:DNA-binding transcriptional LysR family regulator